MTWARTAPKPVLEVLVWTMNGCVKFGLLNIGLDRRACFKHSTALSTAWFHTKVLCCSFISQSAKRAAALQNR